MLPQTGGIVCKVTTPWQADAAAEARARAAAAYFGATYVPRANRSVATFFAEESCDALAVADVDLRLYHRDGPEAALFFHPGMAAQRIARLAKREPDRLLAAGGIGPGDTVVDATLGMATDALVLAHAVGDGGRVIGIESVQPVYALFAYVQQYGSPAYSAYARLLQRVQLVQTAHAAWLAAQPDNAVDVVYFDPMFERKAASSAAIEPLRSFADNTPLSDFSWHHACRIARRAVIVKERPGSRTFHRFGLVADRPRHKIAYGVWRKSHAQSAAWPKG